MTQQPAAQDRAPQLLHYEALEQSYHVLFVHPPKKEYRQKEDVPNSPAASFLTPCQDGAT